MEQRYVYQLAQAFYNNEDDAQAYTYFRQSAEQGYAPAQHGLGKLYRMGRGLCRVRYRGGEVVFERGEARRSVCAV